jgi:hypothetical protein
MLTGLTSFASAKNNAAKRSVFRSVSQGSFPQCFHAFELGVEKLKIADTKGRISSINTIRASFSAKLIIIMMKAWMIFDNAVRWI